MKKGGAPVVININEGDNDLVLRELGRVWKGELDGIMVTHS
jgi:hypothetical protein